MRKGILVVGLLMVLSLAFVPLALADEGASIIDVFGAAGILAVAIPFIIGALKKYAKLPSAWCPAVAFVLGALGGLIAFYLKFAAGMSLFQAVLAGIAIGGTSTGLYDIKEKMRLALYGEKK